MHLHLHLHRRRRVRGMRRVMVRHGAGRALCTRPLNHLEGVESLLKSGMRDGGYSCLATRPPLGCLRMKRAFERQNVGERPL